MHSQCNHYFWVHEVYAVFTIMLMKSFILYVNNIAFISATYTSDALQFC